MFPIPYGHIINRFPNIAPNSRSKDYRKFKAAYEERAHIVLAAGDYGFNKVDTHVFVEAASIKAFVITLNTFKN